MTVQKSSPPTLEDFLNWPVEKVAAHVRAGGSKVVVFPINGTRRWFILEYPEQARENFLENYLKAHYDRHPQLYRLLFEHGIDTLLTPMIGPDILERGDEYAPILKRGLLWFARSEIFFNFCCRHEIRVRLYGDARRYLKGPYTEVPQAFESLVERTRSHRRYRLFMGIYAHDPSERVAEIGVNFHREHGRLPTRREIVTAYYGEYVEPVDFFIGSDRPAAFDMPLVATGSEDLYFTVSPSPYLDDRALRTILYDHLFSRRVDDESYANLDAEDWQAMKRFYEANRHSILGVGRRDPTGSFWYPLPQVDVPANLFKRRSVTSTEHTNRSNDGP